MTQRAVEQDEERERLLAEARRDLDAMTRLHHIGTLVLPDGRVPESVLAEIVDAAIAISGADFGNIQILDPGANAVEFWNRVSAEQGLCAPALQRGERVIVEDIEQSPIFAGTPALEIQRRAGVRAVQCTPLVSRSGRAIGMFSTHFKTPHRPDDRTLRLLDILARETADIIDRAQAADAVRLYEKTKELDRLKTELFANVSHELRTPLALILGPTEHLLASPSLDGETRRQLEVVRRNALTLSRHVEDLLEVARIDAGQAQPRYAHVDVAWLVRFVASHFQVLAADRRTDFAIDGPHRLVAQVDRDMVQRILTNIVGNAFRFTPEGGRIRISLRAGRPRFRIEIGDSGPGIPPDKRLAIFDRFSRLEGDPRPYGGTGLGLAIVKELVELHAGSVVVEDAPEGGALFVVELPVSAPDGAAVRPAEPRTISIEIAKISDTLREPVPTPGALHPGGQLVLVVEDNREMNAFIADCLGEAGLRVATAFDGAEGIAKALELRPDLVLTDIMMPGMNGAELVHALRRRPQLDAMPIVVLSAKADAELRVRLLREGAQDWLAKPFAPSELEARVGNLLSRKRAEERVATLQRQVDAVMEATRSVSEAVASLPESSVPAVLETIAVKARNLTSAEYAGVGLGRDPDTPFDLWVEVGRAPESTPASQLAVPIHYQDEPVGRLYLANKRGAPQFTEQDHRIVEMLAGRVGVAIQTARLYSAVGKERSWLRAVVDQMPEALVLVGETGRVTAQNRAALALAGDEIGRDPFGNTVTIDLRDSKGQRLALDQYPNVRAIRDRESTHAVELVTRLRDGRRVPVLVSATPVITSDGELAGAMMLLQDVSTLKELERLREEWAAIVAHDLQQPVNATVLITDLLLRGELGDKNRERVERIRALVTHVSRMISDLSDASQLEAHRLVIARERIDLCAFAKEVVQHVPAAARRTTVNGDGELLVRGDAGRLEQVLTNLLSNAVKYGAPDTEIRVDVTAENPDARISITNHGTGIPEDELPRLFDRFMRTRDARAGSVKGSGLGLYIAKGLVEAHGGRIWVESAHGETTFHLSLPRERGA